MSSLQQIGVVPDKLIAAAMVVDVEAQIKIGLGKE